MASTEAEAPRATAFGRAVAKTGKRLKERINSTAPLIPPST